MAFEVVGWSTMAEVVSRLDGGWELYDDDGSWRWYSETRPGFADEDPTPAAVRLILAVRAGF